MLTDPISSSKSQRHFSMLLFFETFNWVLKMIWNFVNYTKIAKCFYFGHRRVNHIELWKALLLGHIDQPETSAASSFFPQLSFPPTHKSIPCHLFSFSYLISCIALAATTRFFWLLKKHLLINSLATVVSPSAQFVSVTRMWCLAAYY